MNNNSFPFSSRSGWDLSSNPLITTLNKLKEEGEVIDLTESNPTRCGYRYDGVLEGLSSPDNLKYTPDARGLLKAREAVVQYYKDKGVTISPEQVFLTSSTSEGYSYVFRLLANSGDCVLFPKPSYPLFDFLGDLNDVALKYYLLKYDMRWSVDLDSFDAPKDTRAFVCVNPNNPTGSFLNADEIKKINALCVKHNWAIICDEVFHDFTHQEGKHPTLSANTDVLTFTLSGISKILGLPQMKVSWIVVSGPDQLVKEAGNRLEVIADTYLSVSAPVQNALPSWLAQRDAISDQIRERVRQNKQYLVEAFKNKDGYGVLNSEGGWYAVLKLPEGANEEEWVMRLLTERRVFAHPGYFFDFDVEGFVVVSLLSESKQFEEGVLRIKKGVETF